MAEISISSQIEMSSSEEAHTQIKNKSFMKKFESERKGSKVKDQLCSKNNDDCSSGLVCKKKFPDFSNGKKALYLKNFKILFL